MPTITEEQLASVEMDEEEREMVRMADAALCEILAMCQDYRSTMRKALAEDEVRGVTYGKFLSGIVLLAAAEAANTTLDEADKLAKIVNKRFKQKSKKRFWG